LAGGPVGTRRVGAPAGSQSAKRQAEVPGTAVACLGSYRSVSSPWFRIPAPWSSIAITERAGETAPYSVDSERPLARVDEDRRLADRQVERPAIQSAAEELARRFPQVQAVWLFGSYARGESRRTSDVDLAVMTEREAALDHSHRSDLIDEAERLLAVPVEVVLLHADLPLPLLWEILSRPVLLYARDPEDAAAFASGLRGLVREDWPRLERRWERAMKWLQEA
jgi:predicted nucleotidyltransferase